MNLLKLFGIDTTAKQDFGRLFDRIGELTVGYNESELKEVTATAGILGRVAYADTQITDDELKQIKTILQNESRLSSEVVNVVSSLIQDQKIELLTLEEHFYTRLANEVMTKEKKVALLKSMFKIAAADGTICLEEEKIIYITATSLKISKQELIELKRSFKEYLSVFK